MTGTSFLAYCDGNVFDVASAAYIGQLVSLCQIIEGYCFIGEISLE